MEEVVVVGAGPVGLWLSCELRLAGLNPLVLERADQRSPYSKALTVHPRSIELLAMRGLAKQFLAEGIKIPSGHFGALETRLDFGPLDTPYPFTLMFPQARTEELLEQHAHGLGVRILRGHAVTDVAQDESSVRVEVAGPDGAWTAQCSYVVACDGVHSVVRRAAAIDFPGTDATVHGFLGDVRLDDPPKQPALTLLGAAGLLMAVPLPGGVHRFVGVDHERQNSAGTAPSYEEFRDSVTSIAGTDFGMRDPIWLSRFHNATRQAAQYRLGRILVAGDAAHMHFPAGGVGLNAGIQDAMNLGWKLAAEVQGRAPAGLLDTYHHERHPVGAALLERSQAQTALITAFSPEGQALRSLLGKLIAAHPAMSLDLAGQLSALDIAYPPSDPNAHPLVGLRAPDLNVAADPAIHLFDLLHDGRAVLLDLTNGALPAATQLAASLGIRTHAGVLGGSARPAWAKVQAALIRPDGHVWWATDDTTGTDAAALDALTATHAAG